MNESTSQNDLAQKCIEQQEEIKKLRQLLKNVDRGMAVIEQHLKKAELGNPSDAPLDVAPGEARLWHEASRSAYLHALELCDLSRIRAHLGKESLAQQTPSTMDAQVKQHLAELGWTANKSGSTLAHRVVQTKVGEKVAGAMLSDGDGINRTLCGVFYSEGRNILENCGILIPVKATESEIYELTKKFNDGAMAALLQSYAVRLLSQNSKNDV